MKKSLLALAVLGAFAGVASAQSSVTLYGTVDLNGRYIKNSGSSGRYSMGQDGINSSQLGFRGIEDLGGGLKASFVLLSGVNADTGSANGKFFNRRSTVSISGGFGEVRLGRDYVPTFWNNTLFDPFGTNGLGDSSHVLQLTTPTFVRADNAVQYFLPSNIGGFYGQVMAAAGEGGPSTATGGNINPSRYLSGRIGYAAGPFDIAFAADQQRNVTGPSQKAYNIAGSYDFSVVKIMGFYQRDELDDFRENRFNVGAVVPLGQFEIHAAYSRSKLDGGFIDNNVVDQWALGGVYNLSKRTAFYGTVARLSNDNQSNRALTSTGNGTSGAALPTLGGKSSGGEFGIRHFF